MPTRVATWRSGRLPVACCGVRKRPASAVVGCLLAVTAAALAACSSGDSTVSKTPIPATETSTPTTETTTPTGSETSTPTSTPTSTTSAQAAPAPCAVNLAAPEIAQAVAQLPRDPRSRQGWNPEPVAGNYNACSPLSAVIVKANTNAENPNTRAVLFHQGQYISSGVPDTFGFTGVDAAQSTGDTLALTFASGPGLGGLQSVVRFRWNGSGVELIGNTE